MKKLIISALLFISLNAFSQTQEVDIAALRGKAEQGDVEAQRDLGFMYYSGRGVAEDATEAAKWYRKAADQGNAMAQAMLGTMYLKGKGVTKDEAESLKWFQKAADQGYVLAQSSLADVQVSKMSKDEILATFWDIIESTISVGSIEKTTMPDLTILDKQLLSQVPSVPPLATVVNKLRQMRGFESLQGQIQLLYQYLNVLPGSANMPKSEKAMALFSFDPNVRNTVTQLMQARVICALYNDEINKSKGSNANNIEALVEKSKQQAKSNVVVKGLYVGMPITDALKLLSHYYNGPVTIEKRGTKQLLVVKNETFTGVTAIAASMLNSQAIATQSIAETEAGNDKVTEFIFPEYVVNSLFGADQMTAQQFARQFCEAYNIGKMDGERIDIPGVDGKKKGFRNVYVYRTAACEILIYDDPVIFGKDDYDPLGKKALIMRVNKLDKNKFN